MIAPNTVEQRVHEILAIHWWIDAQIAAGKTDDEIVRGLPVAVAVITGRIPLDQLPAGDG